MATCGPSMPPPAPAGYTCRPARYRRPTTCHAGSGPPYRRRSLTLKTPTRLPPTPAPRPPKPSAPWLSPSAHPAASSPSPATPPPTSTIPAGGNKTSPRSARPRRPGLAPGPSSKLSGNSAQTTRSSPCEQPRSTGPRRTCSPKPLTTPHVRTPHERPRPRAIRLPTTPRGSPPTAFQPPPLRRYGAARQTAARRPQRLNRRAGHALRIPGAAVPWADDGREARRDARGWGGRKTPPGIRQAGVAVNSQTAADARGVEVVPQICTGPVAKATNDLDWRTRKDAGQVPCLADRAAYWLPRTASCGEEGATACKGAGHECRPEASVTKLSPTPRHRNRFVAGFLKKLSSQIPIRYQGHGNSRFHENGPLGRNPL